MNTTTAPMTDAARASALERDVSRGAEALKTCPRCDQVLPRDCFPSTSNGAGKKRLQSYCKPCEKERSKQRYLDNKALYHARYKKWAAKNTDKKNAYNKAWAKNNPEMYAEQLKKRYARHKDKILLYLLAWRAALPDAYVVNLMGLQREDAPQDLIEKKREQLQIYRLARQLKKAKHESSKDTR